MFSIILLFLVIDNELALNTSSSIDSFFVLFNLFLLTLDSQDKGHKELPESCME